MIRLNPPKKRPRQQPVRKGQAVQYNRDAALSEAGEKERKAAEKRAQAAEKFMQDKDIKPAYKHSKIGNFMFFICAKATKLLTKAR